MNNFLEKVEKQYKNNFYELGDRKFHFASRLFLWTKDAFSEEKLKELKREYIGNNEGEYAQKIETILGDEKPPTKLLYQKMREPYFLKYPLLKAYTKILFRNLFCKTVYGIELRETIEQIVPTELFLELQKRLKNDPQAIAALSTHAVNYFYILDFYLGGKGDAVLPEFLLDIAENNELFKDNALSGLKLYFLTHCIIGETAFYSRRIEKSRETYRRMFDLAESEIRDQYEYISLDNKFEFLVCALVCGVPTTLFERIMEEASGCFDFEKQCIADTKNVGDRKNMTLAGAEHRNVLALMAAHFDKNML